MFALMSSKWNDFYIPVPNGRDRDATHAFGIPTTAVFSYLGDNLHSSGLRVQDHLGRMAEV